MENEFIEVMSKHSDEKLLFIVEKDTANYRVDAIEAAMYVLKDRGTSFKEPIIVPAPKERPTIETPKTSFQKRMETRSKRRLYIISTIGPLFLLYGLSNSSSSHTTIGFGATVISWPLLYWQFQIDKKKANK